MLSSTIYAPGMEVSRSAHKFGKNSATRSVLYELFRAIQTAPPSPQDALKYSPSQAALQHSL